MQIGNKKPHQEKSLWGFLFGAIKDNHSFRHCAWMQNAGTTQHNYLQGVFQLCVASHNPAGAEGAVGAVGAVLICATSEPTKSVTELIAELIFTSPACEDIAKVVNSTASRVFFILFFLI